MQAFNVGVLLVVSDLTVSGYLVEFINRFHLLGLHWSSLLFDSLYLLGLL